MKVSLLNGEEYNGEFMRIEIAIWNKRELTLSLDLGESQINIPMSQIKEIINEEYFKEVLNG